MRQFWNKDRSADIPPVLIEAEGSRGEILRRERAMIACPVIGIQRRVSKILHQIAVELQRAAFGNKTNLPTRRSPVLGVVIGREDLYLLNAVDVLRAEHGPRRPRSGGDGAVHHHYILIRATPVDIESPVRNALPIESADLAAAHPSFQQRERNRIATVQRQVQYLF